MNKLLVVATLFAAFAVPAAADPKPLPPAADKVAPQKKDVASPSCAAKGTALFERTKTTKDHKGATTVDSIFDTRAHQRTTTDPAKKDAAAKPISLCITDDQLATVKDAIKTATWKVTTAKVKCMAMSNDITNYSVNGKQVYSEYLCSGQTLDDKSAAALEKLKTVLDGF